MKYPDAPRADVIDNLHGVAVPDPFRRLESADDPETVAWVAAQNELCRSLLDSPLRARLTARLRELHHVSRMSVPAVRGERIFFTENDGTRGQALLYSSGGLGLGTGGSTVLVDPNLLDPGGTTAITVFEPDDSGDRVVYGLSRHGSDAQELLIHDVAAGTPLADRLEWVKFASIAWWGDGFFYTRYPQPGTVPAGDEQYFCQVWHHRVGDPQASDQRVYHRPDAREVVFDVKVTSDAQHLVIGSYQGASDHAEIHVVRLDETVRLPPSPLGGFGETRKADTTDTRALVTGFSSGWHFVDGRDGRLYFRTDADAPFGRIVRFDLDEGRPEGLHDTTSATPEARVVVPESHDTIVDAAVANGRLLVSSLRHASSRLTTWSLDGGDERAIALPGIGTISGLGARWTDARSFATFTSFTMPPAIMACHGDALAPIRQSALPFDPAQYVTEQVWYRSKDGTPISMFLVSKREYDGRPKGLHYDGTERDGRRDGPHDDGTVRDGRPEEARRRQACLLTGYGGFNISLTPAFDPSDVLWLDEGGTIAVANLRGGGEYGDAWHRAGMRERKQNVFDDFIAAAEWLESSGRAGRGGVAIEGGSNGGLLVGACLVQRPDLFGAAICRVPVADMLRYHLFTVGRFWIPEYGCADADGDFPFLLRYSPYHNVIDGTAYPPTLVMTADTDDRVAPGMAKKFAARLQEATAGTAGGPILLRVETRAGHGAGKPVEKQIDEQADLHAFLFHYLTRTSVNEHTRR
jgi:prolyl oligopeptidase